MSKIRLVISAVAAFGVVTLSACSNEEEPPPPIKTTSSQEERQESQKKSRSKEFSEDDLTKAVTKADLGSADVGRDVSRGGHDDTLEQPTNDICGKQGDSDKNRIARIQDHFWVDGQENASLVVSNEVVAYKPGTGADVLSELESAVASCDKWEHDSGEMTRVHIVEPPSGAAGASFAWQGTDVKNGQDFVYTAVYQTNGDLMSAIYVWAKDGSTMNDVLGDVVPKAADKLESAL